MAATQAHLWPSLQRAVRLWAMSESEAWQLQDLLLMSDGRSVKVPEHLSTAVAIYRLLNQEAPSNRQH